MAESALGVNVPEAEPNVGALRARFDPAAKLGVPAHITVPTCSSLRSGSGAVSCGRFRSTPYGGLYDSIIPHLTVAQAGTAEHDVAEAELVAALPAQGGIEACCNEVVPIENSSGRWERMQSFRLARLKSTRGARAPGTRAEMPRRHKGASYRLNAAGSPGFTLRYREEGCRAARRH